MAETSPAVCFRLRGEVEGLATSFVVEEGLHLVGSDPAAEIMLRVRGVSRRHARLTAGTGGVEVEDLGSKNGTQINGQQVSQGLALVGDELAFGPIALRLEPAVPDDALLGLSLEPPSTAGAELTAGEDTTWLARPEDLRGEPELEVLWAVLDRLSGPPEPDFEGVASLLAAELDASGAALVEWPRSGGVISLAAAGEVGPVPAREQLPTPAADMQWSRLQGSGPAAFDGVALHKNEGDLGIVAWGAAAFAAERLGWKKATWLALILRLCEGFRLRTLADDPDADARSEEVGTLHLPRHIVRGESPAMVALYQQMAMLKQANIPVLVLGETGVGKEHLAKALHDSSERRSGRFVAVNCAAIPSELLEAEMFGIGKGVATGVQPRRGKFSEASGGTLFLDEIAEMPVKLQAKLLRALQEKEIHPLGRAPEKVDVRVVAATNTNLLALIAEGHFRQDLYYRLAGYVLRVPPLRARTEDLPRLVGHFLRRFCRDVPKNIKGVSVEALRRLAAYPWPGNVRELEHEVRRLVYLCPPNQAIDSEMLSEHIVSPPETELQPLTAAEAGTDDGQSDPQIEDGGAARQPALPGDTPLAEDSGLVERLDALEVTLLRRALERTAGNQSRAARRLRISRNSLARRLEKHGIDADEFKA